MNMDGSSNTSIVENVIMELDSYHNSELDDQHKIIVIKSTITPGFTKSINAKIKSPKSILSSTLINL